MDSIPPRGSQHLGVRSATEAVGQARIADVPRQHHAAYAQGDERERTIARPRLSKVVFKDLDHLLYDLLVGISAALDVPSSGQQPSRSSKCSREKWASA